MLGAPSYASDPSGPPQRDLTGPDGPYDAAVETSDAGLPDDDTSSSSGSDPTSGGGMYSYETQKESDQDTASRDNRAENDVQVVGNSSSDPTSDGGMYSYETQLESDRDQAVADAHGSDDPGGLTESGKEVINRRSEQIEEETGSSEPTITTTETSSTETSSNGAPQPVQAVRQAVPIPVPFQQSGGMGVWIVAVVLTVLAAAGVVLGGE